MSLEPISLAEVRARLTTPQTQEAWCLFAARMAIAAMGPPSEDVLPICARGMAEGLFGEVYQKASLMQQMRWRRMCERAFRRATMIGALGGE